MLETTLSQLARRANIGCYLKQYYLMKIFHWNYPNTWNPTINKGSSNTRHSYVTKNTSNRHCQFSNICSWSDLSTVKQTLGWVAVFYPQDLTVGQNSGNGYPGIIIHSIGHPSPNCWYFPHHQFTLGLSETGARTHNLPFGGSSWLISSNKTVSFFCLFRLRISFKRLNVWSYIRYK